MHQGTADATLPIASPLPAAPPAGADLAGLEPMETLKRRWPMVLGAIITVAMVFGLARKLLGSGLAGLISAFPHSPWFYVFFALLYLSPVTGDFVIFRRLWRIPVTGFPALIKKRIANEVLAYSGEAYFYAWARQRATMVAAPFGAVKDVSILSAIAGNTITLAMIAVALPLGSGLLTHDQFVTVAWSIAATFAMSVPFLLFSKRVFSLPRRTLWWIFGVHCARLLAGSILIAVAWHFGLPTVSIGMWLLLAATRLLVSRLPLIPSKDLVFANVAVLLIGQDDALAKLVAVTAALTLVAHVVLIVTFAAWDLVRGKNAVA